VEAEAVRGTHAPVGLADRPERKPGLLQNACLAFHNSRKKFFKVFAAIQQYRI